MFCNQCGEMIADDAKVCPKCGKEVAAAAPQGSTAPQNKSVQVNLGSIEKEWITGNIDFANFDVNKVIENAKYNMIALIACAVMFINVFLPFISVNFFVTVSASLLQSGGWFFIVLALAGAAFACLRMSLPLFGTGCLSVIVMLYYFFKVIGVLEEGVGVGIGFFLMILSSLALVAAPFINKYVLKK